MWVDRSVVNGYLSVVDGMSMGRLVGICGSGLLMGGSVGRYVGRSVGRLVGRSVGRSVYGSVGL